MRTANRFRVSVASVAAAGLLLVGCENGDTDPAEDADMDQLDEDPGDDLTDIEDGEPDQGDAGS
jgi:hypothetical protein